LQVKRDKILQGGCGPEKGKRTWEVRLNEWFESGSEWAASGDRVGNSIKTPVTIPPQSQHEKGYGNTGKNDVSRGDDIPSLRKRVIFPRANSLGEKKQHRVLKRD